MVNAWNVCNLAGAHVSRLVFIKKQEAMLRSLRVWRGRRQWFSAVISICGAHAHAEQNWVRKTNQHVNKRKKSQLKHKNGMRKPEAKREAKGRMEKKSTEQRKPATLCPKWEKKKGHT